MNENVMHVLIAMISSLGGVGAWRFYEAKLKYRATQSANPQKANENFISDLQARVAKLEALLIESSEEKDKLRDSIISLSSEVSGLKVKIKFLESENTENAQEAFRIFTTY
jgi:septal ring factor EnvC (AmiA/AmiB activator)